MRHFILFYEYSADYLARRDQYREEHLRLAREANARGELLLAGRYDEPSDGAAFVWRTEDTSPIERFVDADPYARNGLVVGWRIRPWAVVVGAGE